MKKNKDGQSVHPKMGPLKFVDIDGSSFMMMSSYDTLKRASRDDDGVAVWIASESPKSHPAWQKERRVVKNVGQMSKFMRNLSSEDLLLNMGASSSGAAPKSDNSSS